MIRFGIIGAGRIANRFAESLGKYEGAKLCAISGRNEEKMIAFRDRFSCERYYLDHDALIGDPGIDAVYIGLPNFLHKEYVMKALNAGKAVLCEKPMPVSYADAAAMAGCARQNDTLLMEAMKTRFTPCYREVKEYIAENSLEIRRIDITYGVAISRDDPARFDPRYGGVIRDLGVYGVNWFADLLEGSYTAAVKEAELRGGCDMYVKAELNYENGVVCTLEVAYDRKIPATAVITLDDRKITVSNMHRPDGYSVEKDGLVTDFPVPYAVDDFYGEIDEFCSLINSNKKESSVMDFESTFAVVKMTDEIRLKTGVNC